MTIDAQTAFQVADVLRSGLFNIAHYVLRNVLRNPGHAGSDDLPLCLRRVAHPAVKFGSVPDRALGDSVLTGDVAQRALASYVLTLDAYPVRG